MSAERANQLVEAGVWLQATGDADGARRLFEQALKLDPGNPRARQFLGKGPPAQLAPRPEYPANPFQRPFPSTPSRGVPVRPPPFRGPADEPLPPPVPGTSPATSPAAAPSTRPGTTPGTGPASSPSTAPQLPPPAPFDLDLDASWAEAISGEPAFATDPPWHPEQPPVALPEDAASAWDTESRAAFEVHSPRMDRADPLALLRDPTRAPATPDGPSAREVDEELQTLLSGAEDLLGLDDHSGAMDLILMCEKLAPKDPRVQQLKQRSEQTLTHMFESKLGNLEVYPRLVLKEDEIIWLNLDHRAGFVLAQIDGTVTFDDLFAVSGMSRLDTARILAQLLEEGVISAG